MENWAGALFIVGLVSDKIRGICCDKVGVSSMKPSIATCSQKMTTDGGGIKQHSCSDCHCVHLWAGYGEVEHMDHPVWMGQAYVGEYKLVLTRNNSKTAGACVSSDAQGPFKGV